MSRPRITSIKRRIAIFLSFRLAVIPLAALMMFEKKLNIEIGCIRLQYSLNQENLHMSYFPKYNGRCFVRCYKPFKSSLTS